MSTSNFQRAVKDALLKLANKIDSSGSYNVAKSDYYDVVISSVTRIADKFNLTADVAALESAVEGLSGKLPSEPEEDGTYSLTVTVDNGAATYAWSAASDDSNPDDGGAAQ